MFNISFLVAYLLKFKVFNSDSEGILETLNPKLSRISPFVLTGSLWHGGLITSFFLAITTGIICESSN
jgi:hypothetical protein